MGKSKVRKAVQVARAKARTRAQQELTANTHPQHNQSRTRPPASVRPKSQSRRPEVQEATLDPLRLPKLPIKRYFAEPAVIAAWNDSPEAVAVALGSEDPFLESLTPEAKEALSACVHDHKLSTAYAELLACGMLKQNEPDRNYAFLNNHYQGAWEDVTFSIGPFLRDVSGSDKAPLEVRELAYKRFAEIFQVNEFVQPSGRTIVWIDTQISDEDRFLANQYMIHGTFPTVMSFT